MPTDETREVLRNIDQRLQRVEQFLPTLATKDVLETLATKDELKTLATKDDLKPLATKDELKAAVALLATKEELAAAVAPLATKEEVTQAVREEGERNRSYTKVLIEEVKDTIRVFGEGLAALGERDARQHADTLKRHTALESRVTSLEAKRPRRRD